MTYPALEFDALPARGRSLHMENAILGDILRATVDAADAASGAARSVEILREFFGTASVGVWFMDGDEIRLVGLATPPTASASAASTIIGSFSRVPLAQDGPGPRVMRERRMLEWEASDPSLGESILEALELLGAGRLYAFPILLAGEPVGCGLVSVPGDRRLGGDEQRIVRNVLEHVARLNRGLTPWSAGSEPRPPRPPRPLPGEAGRGAEGTRPAQRARVLLAEDDDITADVLRHRFERAGLAVHRCRTGDEALAACAELDPDLCIIELKLPGLDGLEFVERIRADAAKRDVPVIVLASFAHEKVVGRAFALGADDFVLKPFSLTELIARATRLLARSAPVGGDA